MATSTSMHEAAAGGDLDLVQQLLSAGSSVDTAREADGSTPLLLAALGGHTSTVELLLEHHASPTTAKSNGATPVFAAAAADGSQSSRHESFGGSASSHSRSFATASSARCQICDEGGEAARTLLCDGCDLAYHMRCLDPPA